MYEAFVNGGTVMEGTKGAFGGGMVPRRARPIPSYLAPEPFNPAHASVPVHRQPRYPVRTVKNDNTPPLEDPFPRQSGGGPAAYRNIFGVPGIVIRHGEARGHLGEQVYFPIAPNWFAFLRATGLRLRAVASDPLRGDTFVLHLVAHFVADVGIGTLARAPCTLVVLIGHFKGVASMEIPGDPVHHYLSPHKWSKQSMAVKRNIGMWNLKTYAKIGLSKAGLAVFWPQKRVVEPIDRVQTPLESDQRCLFII